MQRRWPSGGWPRSTEPRGQPNPYRPRSPPTFSYGCMLRCEGGSLHLPTQTLDEHYFTSCKGTIPLSHHHLQGGPLVLVALA